LGRRRRSREYALQALYQLDQTGDSVPSDVFVRFWIDQDATDEVKKFCEELVRGVHEFRDEIDARIRSVAAHWKTDRMAVVDLNVLRIAVFEMFHDGSAPPAVVIDEAVEVARKFGSEQSARFVNGILDALRRGDDPGKAAQDANA